MARRCWVAAATAAVLGVLAATAGATKAGCRCMPTSLDHNTGKYFEGCGWPTQGWCDVAPGCAGAREASAPDDELRYDGWDECLPGEEVPTSPTELDDLAAAERAKVQAQALADLAAAQETAKRKAAEEKAAADAAAAEEKAKAEERAAAEKAFWQAKVAAEEAEQKRVATEKAEQERLAAETAEQKRSPAPGCFLRSHSAQGNIPMKPFQQLRLSAVPLLLLC